MTGYEVWEPKEKLKDRQDGEASEVYPARKSLAVMKHPRRHDSFRKKREREKNPVQSAVLRKCS